jgi:hypothetical protein
MSDPESDPRAVILPNIGTVVLRGDGSAMFTDRNRERFVIAPEIVSAIILLGGAIK